MIITIDCSKLNEKTALEVISNIKEALRYKEYWDLINIEVKEQ